MGTVGASAERVTSGSGDVAPPAAAAGEGEAAVARRIAVMPSRRKEIIWSFSRRSARRPLKARARTPISSRPETVSLPVYEPSRTRSTRETSVRTGPVMRAAAAQAARSPRAMTPSETSTRLLRNWRNAAVSAARLRRASAAPISWPPSARSGIRTPM